MTTLPQYQMGKLASRVVGVPLYDQSGKMMVESQLQADQSILQDKVAASGARVQGIDRAFSVLGQGLAQGVSAFQSGYNQAAAQKMQQSNAATAASVKLAGNQKSGNINSTLNQKYIDYMDSINKPGTNWTQAAKGFPNTVNQWKQDLLDERNNLGYPDVANDVENYSQNLIQKGQNQIGEWSHGYRASEATAGRDQTQQEMIDKAAVAAGDPVKTAEQLQLAGSTPFLQQVTPTTAPNNVKPYLDSTRQKIAVSSLESGLNQAQNKLANIHAMNGDIMGGIGLQLQKLQMLDANMQNPIFKQNMTEPQWTKAQRDIQGAIALVQADHEKAIQNDNAKLYGDVTSLGLKASLARDSGNEQAAAEQLRTLSQMADVQNALPEDKRDKELLNHIAATVSKVVGVKTGIENAAIGALLQNRAEEDRKAALQNAQTAANQAAVDKGIALTKTRDDKIYISDKAIDSRKAIRLSFDSLQTKVNSVSDTTPPDAHGYIAGTGITAKEIKDLNQQVEQAHAEKFLEQKEYEKHLANIDKFRKATIPTTLTEPKTLDFNWNPEFQIKHGGASPGLKTYLGLPDDSAERQILDAKFADQFDIEKKNALLDKKTAENRGWNDTVINNLAAERANQKILSDYMAVGHEPSHLKPIVVAPTKVIPEVNTIKKEVKGMVNAPDIYDYNAKTGVAPAPPEGRIPGLQAPPPPIGDLLKGLPVRQDYTAPPVPKQKPKKKK